MMLKLLFLRFSGGFDINVFTKVHGTGDVSVMHDVTVDLVTNAIEGVSSPRTTA
ncbi:hypothetical protein ERO13_A07G107866v2 [Gossypium hirsutum]|uniref:Uncharacterized protein n=2 Tax=Gossypium TaxID=3633 RepID=A0A5J5V240_GOSBA|nr:hypothetical protein ES319_A07G117800v1 [Gossypium barbadense]KAG4191646.1 hypothetical protein ERO13_A07G107866v2 [Gossypium hirsutum]TYH09796.1 hypothetical protein ES288_A07G125800v1 [Gossypium darwinii]